MAPLYCYLDDIEQFMVSELKLTLSFKFLTFKLSTPFDPLDCSPPISSFHGILLARILEWVAISFSRDLPNPGIKLRSSTLQSGSLPSEPQGKPNNRKYFIHLQWGLVKSIYVKCSLIYIKVIKFEDLDFTHPYKDINNTSTSGTIHTEHLLNTSRGSQTP